MIIIEFVNRCETEHVTTRVTIMSLLKYFSWKETTSVTKEVLLDPSGSLSKEVPSSTIAATNEITVTILTVSKKKEYSRSQNNVNVA